MSTAHDDESAETGAIAEYMGVPLGTFRAKWARIRFARHEPEWSQSANAYAGELLHYALAMARAEAATSDADQKTYGPAFMAAFQAAHYGLQREKLLVRIFGWERTEIDVVFASVQQGRNVCHILSLASCQDDDLRFIRRRIRRNP